MLLFFFNGPAITAPQKKQIRARKHFNAGPRGLRLDYGGFVRETSGKPVRGSCGCTRERAGGRIRCKISRLSLSSSYIIYTLYPEGSLGKSEPLFASLCADVFRGRRRWRDQLKLNFRPRVPLCLLRGRCCYHRQPVLNHEGCGFKHLNITQLKPFLHYEQL